MTPESPTQRVGGAAAPVFRPVTHRVAMLSLGRWPVSDSPRILTHAKKPRSGAGPGDLGLAEELLHGMDMETFDELRFAPDVVLPVQFHAAPATSPEKRLMLAVLEDALDIYRKYGRLPGRKRRRLITETEQWFFSDDTSWPFSFVNVCHAAGIDVGWLRMQLRHDGGTEVPGPATIEALRLAS